MGRTHLKMSLTNGAGASLLILLPMLSLFRPAAFCQTSTTWKGGTARLFTRPEELGRVGVKTWEELGSHLIICYSVDMGDSSFL